MIAVGGSLGHIGGVDNFCWPDIGYDPLSNPDGKFKAAQLVRACRALKDACMGYGIPLLSGKDSMYVDGHLEGAFGERTKVSALETVQFSAVSLVSDASRCVTLEPKTAGDFIFVLGSTGDQMGASEYYEMFGKIGLNVPMVDFSKFKTLYKAIEKAIDAELLSSCHAAGRGGLGVHFSLMAMAGGLGLDIDLDGLPLTDHLPLSAEKALFSESAGRFIVTVSEDNRQIFEKLCKGLPCACLGTVTDQHDRLKIALNGSPVVDLQVCALDLAYNKTFGDMI